MERPVLRTRVSSTATPSKRPEQKARARRSIGANRVGGSHGQREWRKYSLDQLRCWPPWGPDDARQAAPAQAHQGTQGLADGAVKGTRLRETGAPVGHEGEPSGEQGPGASGRRPNVFLSVRMKRSPRAIFLVREETRLSRSTVR